MSTQNSKELSEVTSSYGLQLMSEKPTHNGGGCLDVLFYTSDFMNIFKTIFIFQKREDKSQTTNEKLVYR